MIILFPVSWLLWFLVYSRKNGLRMAWILATVWIFTLIAISTEVLSGMHMLEKAALNYVWSGITVSGFLTYWITGRIGFSPNGILRRVSTIFRHKDRFFLSIAGFYLIVSGAILLATAVIYPPNTGDVLTYHMGRIMHWIQNKDVEPYPTTILRQLYQSPLSEFAVLHLQLLSGTDTYANTIQWMSMACCVIAASLIAKRMGAGARGQFLSAVFAGTVPMGILESTAAKNDILVSFFLLVFILTMLNALRSLRARHIILAGFSIGLAIFSKSTAFLFSFPFFGWFLLAIVFDAKRRKRILVPFLFYIPIIIGLINAGQFMRNHTLFDSITGPNREDFSTTDSNLKYSNDTFAINAMISNVLRNSALQMGTPFDTLNRFFYSGIITIHTTLGIQPDDKRTTWASTHFSPDTIVMSKSDGNANNPIHFLLIISLTLATLTWRKSTSPQIRWYLLASVGSFLLFCIYLKWQPWHSRLHVPFFLIAAPAVGSYIGRLPRRASLVILLACMYGATGYVVDNPDRSFISAISRKQARSDGYFNQISKFKSEYMQVSDLIRQSGCNQIGLLFGRDDPEYLFWVLLDNMTSQRYRMEHIDVKNISAVTADTPKYQAFRPCVIISTTTNADTIETGYGSYAKQWSPEQWIIDAPSIYRRS